MLDLLATTDGDAVIGNLALAVLLLILAFLLFIAEVFLVSFGVLMTGSVIALIGAIICAFQADPAIGWAFVIVSPFVAFFLGRWGIARIQRSKLVPQEEITADAGYHHRAKAIGATIGAIGELLTPARPLGKARFSGGDCDVQVRGTTLDKGARVVVKAIDGPIIFVQQASTTEATPEPETGADPA